MTASKELESSPQLETTPTMRPSPSSWWTRGHAAWWLGFTVVLVASTTYLWNFIDRGWIPHDEGSLAQSAERVLAGELPHRDFVEGYTGGLTYYHALAFKVFGVHLLAIRYALFAAFVPWVAVFYHAATRIMSTLGAIAITLTAVFWSVPNYPAAMSSWYSLFLATGGLAALLQYVDSGKRKWLFAAGLAGGISILVKIHGLFFVGAALLFILYHEAERSFTADDGRRNGVVFQVLVGGILLVAIVALLAIGLSRKSWVDLYQFALPGLAMVALVGRRAFYADGRSRAAATATFSAALPFAVGAAIPVMAFIVHYAAAGALAELLRGVVLLASSAMDHATLNPRAPYGLLSVALAAFVLLKLQGTPGRIAILQNALGIAVVALMSVPSMAPTLEPPIWSSLAEATPVAVPLLAFLTRRSERHNSDQSFRSKAVLVGSVAAFCSLVQYPFAAPVYFSYSLPLLLLAVATVFRHQTVFRKQAVQGIAAVYLVYGALYIAPLPIPGLRAPIVADDTAVLDLPRGGLRVDPNDAREYPVAVQLLRAHASSGVIYAGPDAPELYFLAGLRNPTPAFFDYQVPDSLFHERLVERLDSLGVNVVAIRRHVVHSPPLEPHIQQALASRYPFAREVGRFTIRWR